MPADEVKPEVQPPEAASQQQDQKPPEILPDATAEEQKDKGAELEKELASLRAESVAAKKEKAELERRLKDNQEYIARTRNVEKQQQALSDVMPRKTFDEYLEEVSKKFEDDPKEGLKKVVRDIAYDRDLERQEFEKRVKEAEHNAFKKVLALDPEKGRLMREVERLEADRPDLANLTFDQKMEWLGMRGAGDKKAETRVRIERERDLGGEVGGGFGGRPERLPGWLNDPEVQRDARESGFTSKKDLLEWADPDIARMKAEKMRPKLI